MSETTTSAYDEILRRDQSHEVRSRGHNGRPPQPHHCLTFQTPDEDDLVQLDTSGMMPIPAVGENIVIHDTAVTVSAVRTDYTRDETGTPEIFTWVTVVGAAADAVD